MFDSSNSESERTRYWSAVYGRAANRTGPAVSPQEEDGQNEGGARRGGRRDARQDHLQDQAAQPVLDRAAEGVMNRRLRLRAQREAASGPIISAALPNPARTPDTSSPRTPDRGSRRPAPSARRAPDSSP